MLLSYLCNIKTNITEVLQAQLQRLKGFEVHGYKVCFVNSIVHKLTKIKQVRPKNLRT